MQTSRLTVCAVEVQLDILNPAGGTDGQILTILARRFCQRMADCWRERAKQDRQRGNPGSQSAGEEMTMIHGLVLDVIEQNDIK